MEHPPFLSIYNLFSHIFPFRPLKPPSYWWGFSMVQPEMLDPSRFPFLRSRTRIKALKATDELLRRPGLVAEPFRLLKNCTFSLYICVCVCGCFCSSRRHCPFKRFMAKWGTPCVVRSLVWRRLHPEKWGVWCRWLSSMIFATSEDYRSLKNRLITWFSGGFTECLGCIQGFCGTILHG